MDIVDFGMPLGLAFASGLNAYLPLLAFALSVRWLHMYTVSSQFAFITQTWFIVVLAILTLLDFVADKIPFIDHIWNAVHTVIRPIAGAFVAVAASSHALPVTYITPATGHSRPDATIIELSVIPVAAAGTLVLLIIGGALAFLSHTTKATLRLVSTITTAGFLNIGLSLLENVLALIIILLSLFVPTVMLILLVLLILFLVPQYMRARRTI